MTDFNGYINIQVNEPAASEATVPGVEFLVKWQYEFYNVNPFQLGNSITDHNTTITTDQEGLAQLTIGCNFGCKILNVEVFMTSKDGGWSNFVGGCFDAW